MAPIHLIERPFSRKNPLIITLANIKGGVGKSSCVAGLAGACVDAGLRPLVINLDAQRANISTCLHPVAPSAINSPGYQVLRHGAPIMDHVITTEEGIDLLQGAADLGDAEIHLMRNIQTHALAERLEELPRIYDVILLDCGPSLNMLTINGLYAANRLLVPVEYDYLSLVGMQEVLERARDVMKRSPRLKLAGVCAIRNDLRSLHARATREKMAAAVGEELVLPGVRQDARAKEANANHVPITHYDPKGRAAEDYRVLRDLLRQAVA